MATGEAAYQLKLGDRVLSQRAVISDGPMTVRELLPAIHSLASAISTMAEEDAKSAGREVSCRAGCGACCRQLVPISPDEAIALAQLIDGFEPGRKTRVLARFAEAVAELNRRGVLDALRRFDQVEDAAERRRLGLDYFRFGIACPFLENESCSIHPVRPTICREYVVVSPAEHCARPGEGKIEQVTLRGRPSVALYKFRAHGQPAESRFLPLVLLLEWSARQAAAPEPTLRGPELLRKFLVEMSAKPTAPQSND